VKIQLVTPAPLRFTNGNKITALRWAEILRKLGHKVGIKQRYDGQPCDLLIALHARRSYQSIKRFHDDHPELPLIVVLTGTDLYKDIRINANARRSLEFATRLVALQKLALPELPKRLHSKTRVIYQSAPPIRNRAAPWSAAKFKVCVIGHLRAEKDPLRTALAARRLPAVCRIHVTHVGRALDETLARRARAEMKRNHRYRWTGELSHARTRTVLAESHLLAITSRMEGSSNVMSEALASGVPVIASKIPGLRGTLGDNFAGYFPVGDTRRLRTLLLRSESNHRFYQLLGRQCRRLGSLVKPSRERTAWKRLLREIYLSR
jgi:putative glycosyltransferase (TIGR04348 family)